MGPFGVGLTLPRAWAGLGSGGVGLAIFHDRATMAPDELKVEPEVIWQTIISGARAIHAKPCAVM